MPENEMVENREGPEGCYLIFENSSGGRLMLYYSNRQIPKNAIGFWYVHTMYTVHVRNTQEYLGGRDREIHSTNEIDGSSFRWCLPACG